MMEKELYEKPDIEEISLLNVDIITESAEEGGDVPVEDDDNAANLNEVAESPWEEGTGEEGTETGEGTEGGEITDPETGGGQENMPDIVDDIEEAIEDIITPDEEIQEEIPVEEDINDVE